MYKANHCSMLLWLPNTGNKWANHSISTQCYIMHLYKKEEALSSLWTEMKQLIGDIVKFKKKSKVQKYL